jgi:hypothetical protein
VKQQSTGTQNSSLPVFGQPPNQRTRRHRTANRRCIAENLEDAMAASAAPRNTVDHWEPTPRRNEVLARYRHLREISKQHHHAIMKLVPGEAMLRRARGLGLTVGKKTIVLDRMDDLNFVYDLSIYTAPANRVRAVDHYARSARLAPGSDEALMLEAMCNARFSVLSVQRRHPVAGLIVTDRFRDIDLWLIDEGLEISMRAGEMFATRYFAPDRFVMTAGVLVPFADDMLADVVDSAPQLLRKSPEKVIEDRRFAEAVYRIALADGVMESVAYQDLADVDDATQVRPGESI